MHACTLWHVVPSFGRRLGGSGARPQRAQRPSTDPAPVVRVGAAPGIPQKPGAPVAAVAGVGGSGSWHGVPHRPSREGQHVAGEILKEDNRSSVYGRGSGASSPNAATGHHWSSAKPGEKQRKEGGGEGEAWWSASLSRIAGRHHCSATSSGGGRRPGQPG